MRIILRRNCIFVLFGSLETANDLHLAIWHKKVLNKKNFMCDLYLNLCIPVCSDYAWTTGFMNGNSSDFATMFYRLLVLVCHCWETLKAWFFEQKVGLNKPVCKKQ
jgi:hypothetical protein